MGRVLVLLIVFASSVGSAAPRVAQAPTAPVRVAIIPGVAVNLDTARVDALTQELATALAAELDVEAVGGLEVRRQLPPDGVAPDCFTNPECTADVARRTGASQLLFVVIVDSGASGSIQVDATWVDPATHRTAARPAIDLTSAAEAKAKFGAAARQLLPEAPVREKAPLKIVTAPPAPALIVGVPRHLTTPAKITAAVGIAGLGAGIGFGLAARSRYGACDRDPIGCTESKRDSIRNHALLADLGYAIAFGAAVATIVLYATSGEKPRVIVTPADEGATVSAFGRF